MRTIVCGSRLVGVWDMVDRVLTTIEPPVTTLLCGGSMGIDAAAREWAGRRGIRVEHYPADWKRWGKLAGPKRNEEMAKNAERCIAFPGGKGTADMVRRAKARGLILIDRRETP